VLLLLLCVHFSSVTLIYAFSMLLQQKAWALNKQHQSLQACDSQHTSYRPINFHAQPTEEAAIKPTLGLLLLFSSLTLPTE
jgi:hypothetical protein